MTEHQKVNTRSTAEVFEDHLQKRADKQLEQDIQQNYAPDLLVISGLGIEHGHDGIRKTAADLEYYLPDATFQYRTRYVYGEYAFLEWTGRSPKGLVKDGTDTFVIRDGKIVAQTIHYTVINEE